MSDLQPAHFLSLMGPRRVDHIHLNLVYTYLYTFLSTRKWIHQTQGLETYHTKGSGLIALFDDSMLSGLISHAPGQVVNSSTVILYCPIISPFSSRSSLHHAVVFAFFTSTITSTNSPKLSSFEANNFAFTLIIVTTMISVKAFFFASNEGSFGLFVDMMVEVKKAKTTA